MEGVRQETTRVGGVLFCMSFICCSTIVWSTTCWRCTTRLAFARTTTPSGVACACTQVNKQRNAIRFSRHRDRCVSSITRKKVPLSNREARSNAEYSTWPCRNAFMKIHRELIYRVLSLSTFPYFVFPLFRTSLFLLISHKLPLRNPLRYSRTDARCNFQWDFVFSKRWGRNSCFWTSGLRTVAILLGCGSKNRINWTRPHVFYPYHKNRKKICWCFCRFIEFAILHRAIDAQRIFQRRNTEVCDPPNSFLALCFIYLSQIPPVITLTRNILPWKGT